MLDTIKPTAIAITIVCIACWKQISASHHSPVRREMTEGTIREILHPAYEYPLTPDNVQEFVDAQFKHFFTDCQAFVDSLVPSDPAAKNTIQTSEGSPPISLEYCDARPECLTTTDSILEACMETIGAKHVIHGDLKIHPAAHPYSDFSQVSITGQQTVCLDIGEDHGYGPLTPLCLDFVIHEHLHANEDAAHGLQSSMWHGYYQIHSGSCPGVDAPVLDCNNYA